MRETPCLFMKKEPLSKFVAVSGGGSLRGVPRNHSLAGSTNGAFLLRLQLDADGSFMMCAGP